MFWFAIPFISREITPVGAREENSSEQHVNELEKRMVLNRQHRSIDPVTTIKHAATSSLATSILLIDDSLPYLQLLALEFKMQGFQKVS